LRRFVDDHFVAVLQHLLHGLEIETLGSNVLRGFEGSVHRHKARGIALRAGDIRQKIGLGLLLDPHRVAARNRDDVVAIGFGFVAQARAIGEGSLNVAERVDDLGRRIDALLLQLGDLDPGSVAVENGLQQ
jgi:hypothetical protein